MRTVHDIHSDIDAATDERAQLWRDLSRGHDAAIVADIKALDARLDELWAEHRAVRAALRFGAREEIVKRARTEERLERAA